MVGWRERGTERARLELGRDYEREGGREGERERWIEEGMVKERHKESERLCEEGIES